MREIKRHPFSYTIGEGPYRLVDFFALILPSETNQGRNNFHLAPKNLKGGCGTCAHCGRGIINNYIVQNYEGDRFAIGSECVEKCNVEGQFENMSVFEKQQRQLKRKQGQDRRKKQSLVLHDEISGLIQRNEALLASIYHNCNGPKNALAYSLFYIRHTRTLNGYKIFKQKLIDWGCK